MSTRTIPLYPDTLTGSAEPVPQVTVTEIPQEDGSLDVAYELEHDGLLHHQFTRLSAHHLAGGDWRHDVDAVATAALRRRVNV